MVYYISPDQTSLLQVQWEIIARHLHQRIVEHKNSAIGKHFLEAHGATSLLKKSVSHTPKVSRRIWLPRLWDAFHQGTWSKFKHTNWLHPCETLSKNIISRYWNNFAITPSHSAWKVWSGVRCCRPQIWSIHVVVKTRTARNVSKYKTHEQIVQNFCFCHLNLLFCVVLVAVVVRVLD